MITNVLPPFLWFTVCNYAYGNDCATVLLAFVLQYFDCLLLPAETSTKHVNKLISHNACYQSVG